LFYYHMPPRRGLADFSGNRVAINISPLRGLGLGESPPLLLLPSGFYAGRAGGVRNAEVAEVAEGFISFAPWESPEGDSHEEEGMFFLFNQRRGKAFQGSPLRETPPGVSEFFCGLGACCG